MGEAYGGEVSQARLMDLGKRLKMDQELRWRTRDDPTGAVAVADVPPA